MIVDLLTKRFNKSPDSLPENSEENCLVNYVWISKEQPMPYSQGNPLCTVPLHYIDKALQNAARYPDAVFNIWFDFDLLDPESRFFVESHIYYSGTDNVRVRDMQDIPTYSNDPFFKANDAGKMTKLWSRVDLARLVVLKYTMDTYKDAPFHYYADFDTENVKITHPFSYNALNQHGMFYDCTQASTGLENSFIAFGNNDSGRNFLFDTLIPATQDGTLFGCNGYGTLFREISKWASKHKIDNIFRHISAKRSHPMGYELPNDGRYQDIGIN